MADAEVRELERKAAAGGPGDRIRLSMEGCRRGDHAWSAWAPSTQAWPQLHDGASSCRSCFWCGLVERRLKAYASTLHSDGRLEERTKKDPEEGRVVLGRGRSFERVVTVLPHFYYRLNVDPPTGKDLQVEPFLLDRLRVTPLSPGLQVSVYQRFGNDYRVVVQLHDLVLRREYDVVDSGGIPVHYRIFVTVMNDRPEEGSASLSLSGRPL